MHVLAIVASMLLSAQAPLTIPGATLRIYDLQVGIDELGDLIPGQTPNVDVLIDRIDFKDNFPNGFKERFYAEITAEFESRVRGVYTFRLTSDDGSALRIDGKEVIANDGVHAAVPKTGTVNLEAGWHALKLRYFESGGGEELRLESAGPGQALAVVGKDNLRTPGNVTRVTSPGQKYLAGAVGTRRPGLGMPLEGLHPGWDIMTIRPEDFRPQVGAIAFRKDGKLLVATFHPNQSGEFLPNLKDGELFLLDGIRGTDRSKITVKKIASNLQEPLGLAVIGDDIFVCQRTAVARLRDTNGDDVIDIQETVAKGWTANNYHHFTFGLAALDRKLYLGLSTSITFNAPGINGPNPPFRGSVLRIDPYRYDANRPFGNIEAVTGGHRTPNGIEVGPEGTILVGENQGSWQPANKLNVVELGGFYGHYNATNFPTKEYPKGGAPGAFDEQAFTPPALYLPQNEIANSPAQSVIIPNGEFKGQLLISDVKYGGLRRAFLEKVDGQWQGGVVPYSQGFEVGTNRMVWGPDGALYIGGIGATESWAWTDPKTGKWTTFGLQRIRPNGKSAFEIASVKATETGFRVTFNRPVSPAKLTDPKTVTVRQWNYAPTVDYGGDKKNREALVVTRARASKDGKSVDLTIPGLKPGRVVYFAFDIPELWAAECWYTLNQIPRPPFKMETALAKPNPRVLVFSKTAGFRHDSIPAGIAAIRSFGFPVTATEDSRAFENLSDVDVVVFLNTTENVLNDVQKAKFQEFIRAGGGFVGIHAASDTEKNWPWYEQLVGAIFQSHPEIQQASIKIEDRAHPTTTFLPNDWRHVDEWYNYRLNPRGKVRVLATVDESTYQNGAMGADHPITWCHEFEGGRSWYTGLGHTAEAFDELSVRHMIREGVLWAAQAIPPKGAERIQGGVYAGWKTDAPNAATYSNLTPNGPHLVVGKPHGDAFVHVEFKIPKGGNSGVYLQSRYEVQILDSYGKKVPELQHSDCGGIYQRWKDEAGYEGTAPRVNAARPAGEWNTLDIVFRGPRFQGGKKVENARFIEVRLNGVVVQRNVEVTGPTRASAAEDEVPVAPLLMQGDHGPVSFRNIWIKPL